MQIHQLTVKKRKDKKTVGRGGKRGTYSGRGNKGQKARSGASIDPLFEGGRSSLVERLKKVRGFKSLAAKKAVVKLESLEKVFKDGDIVSMETLLGAKLVDKADVKNGVKILTTGTITKKLTISAEILLSQSAKDAIIKAGGKILELGA
ncbi:MAG: 50S ribosomal protein L15 [Candidatus Moranbacteria bacterium GW2011_GWE1_36_7]|nr:MAG: 50S ribosomal protein L15 [Candidatus Moranbacteria bacterium GW2011_GWD2_36_12]KKQ06260.1 MAG: 50S ribosomal protein L15 [Candidatus Moranbacteria bacterium GW2011_GWE2_36_40]KKQ12322.1 MAG: 50S ribosomal protein L15 [Candidatus Moranbacteria bacterium GW2011_GWE1_36_7]